MIKPILKNVRGYAKIKKHGVILFGALIATFLICNFTEELFKSLINTTYTILVGKTIIFDDSGIPCVNYRSIYGVRIGKQRNPVTVSQVALDYYKFLKRGNRNYRQLFLNCADWLVDNSVSYDDYAILEYRFPWPIYKMTPPWRSGMAQGQAIQVLIKAYNLTKDEKYLANGKRLLNSFFVEVDAGGVTYKSSRNGWWYEEYADDGCRESRVLNGMMFTVLGIYEYYRFAEDSASKFLFDQGVLALRKNLKNYDKNGYSYYDILGQKAGEYHQIHIRLLGNLYNLTNEEIFKEYCDRWEKYQKLPFMIRLIRESTKMGFAIFLCNLFALFLVMEIVIVIFEKVR